MKNYKTLLSVLFVLTFACLIVAGFQTETNAKPKDSNAPTPNKPVNPSVSGAMQPSLATKNDYCEEALKIEPKEITPKSLWQCELKNRTFSSGKSVDDWYVYTTTQNSAWQVPSDVYFGVKLDSTEIKRFSLEVYETCDSWPFIFLKKSALVVTQPGGDEDDLGLDIDDPNALSSQIKPRVGNHKYYFHVNLLDPPTGDAKVKYNLTITESYVEPPK